MDFIVVLPRTQKGFNSIWVIVDMFTKSAHFLQVKNTYSLDQYTKVYIKDIVRLHGVPTIIVPDRDPKFITSFWKSLHQAMGTRLSFSTAFHPQIDGQSERTIRTLEYMLRACVMDFDEIWDQVLPFMEYAYNNSYHNSIRMAPFQVLYGRKCRSPLNWEEEGKRKLVGPEWV